MNALVRKEVRVIAPAWGVAVLAMAAGPAASDAFSIETWAFCLMAFWLAMTLLGLSSFGREFSSRSFSGLLAQPIAREHLWRIKSRWVGGAAISLFGLSLFLVANLSNTRNTDADWDAFLVGTAAGLALLTGGLWTTLLFRQVTAAFWITLLVPAALALGVSLVSEQLVSRLPNVLQLPTSNPKWFIPVALSAVFVLYSIAGYWWARRLFLRAQDVGWAAAERPLLGVGCWFKTGSRPVGEHNRGPLRALVAKEFQLHSLSLFFAAGVLVLHLVAIGVRKFGNEFGEWREAANQVWALWFILPVIVGAEAVASERQLGTMEGQLCLPVRRRTQFVVKVAFVLVAGIILGGAIPWLLETIASQVGAGTDVLTKSYAFGNGLARASDSTLFAWCGLATGLALTSLYASSLTCSTLQALGGSVVGFGVVWALAVIGRFPEFPTGVRLWHGRLFHLIGWLALAVTLLGLSYWNFKRLHQSGRLWRRNLAVLGVWLAFTVAATPLVYHRAWELVLPTEPQHGPARITSVGHFELCSVAERVFILLPDGRLWAGTESEFVRNGVDTVMRRPIAGKFIGESNWTTMAATHVQAVAIQADGSLWTVFDCLQTPSPAIISIRNYRSFWDAFRSPSQVVLPDKPIVITPRRIGSDSDWKALSACGSHFLALKQDGSIWGWGDNGFNQLGEGPKQFTNGPVRIGEESDWTAVFASVWRSAAIKRDGSVWMWGGLYNLPDGTRLKQMLHQPTPIRWNLPGTNLVSFPFISTVELALYGDGSAWAVGRIPPELLGRAANPRSEDAVGRETAPVAVNPVRVNQGEKWRAVTSGQSLTMLHGDGSLWGHTDWWKPRKSPRPKKVSEYSDWVAVAARGSETYALAADGTLCCWAAPPPAADPLAMLGPTRGPLWSLNILDSVK